MDFALNDDHRLLRESAHDFLAGEVDLAPLLVPGAQYAARPADALWHAMVELGWAGLIVPERYGGLGMTHVDLSLVAQEVGRSLAPASLFGTLAGTLALLAAGSEEQKAQILPEVAASGRRLALAMPGAAVDAPGGRLTGRCDLVVDAAAADRLVVAAGDQFFLVDPASAGVTIERLEWRDITREVCRVTLADVAGEPLPVPASAAWPWIRDRLYLILAAESAGGLEHVLDVTAAYARERVAFGRPIGAYQAIKHQLADMKGQVECAGVAVLYAAWALDGDPDAATLAAAMAQSCASDAFADAAFRSIQIFGAIGFTWEMRNHLYLKRARANAVLLGSSAQQRGEIFAILAEREAADR